MGTCQTCHEKAGAGFTQYQPHADPRDRAKNPQLWFTWIFMSSLLIGVLGFFGIHTALWLIRLTIDYRRARRSGGTSHRHASPGEAS